MDGIKGIGTDAGIPHVESGSDDQSIEIGDTARVGGTGESWTNDLSGRSPAVGVGGCRQTN